MRCSAVFLAAMTALGATVGTLAQDSAGPQTRQPRSTVKVDVDMVVVRVTVPD